MKVTMATLRMTIATTMMTKRSTRSPLTPPSAHLLSQENSRSRAVPANNVSNWFFQAQTWKEQTDRHCEQNSSNSFELISLKKTECMGTTDALNSKGLLCISQMRDWKTIPLCHHLVFALNLICICPVFHKRSNTIPLCLHLVFVLNLIFICPVFHKRRKTIPLCLHSVPWSTDSP